MLPTAHEIATELFVLGFAGEDFVGRMLRRESGGGFTVNGCGPRRLAGMSLRTGRLDGAYTGLPVSRCRKNIRPDWDGDDGGNAPPFYDVDERRRSGAASPTRGGELEVPAQFCRCGVEGDRRRVQIGLGSMSAVVLCRRLSDREKDQSTLDIDRP